MNIIDLETDLYRAAAGAMEVVEKINKKEGLRAIKMWYLLEGSVRQNVESTLDGDLPVEDAILHLNKLAGNETGLPEPNFPYYHPAGVL